MDDDRTQGWGALFAAPLVLLLGPFFSFLWLHGHPFARWEVGTIALGLCAVALGCALLNRRWTWSLAPVHFVLLSLFFDYHVKPDWPVMLFVMPVIGALCWLLRAQIATLSLVVGATFYASVVLTVSPQPLWVDEEWDVERGELPPIVHLVFDEQIGPGGLPEEIPGAAELGDEIVAFYTRWGFRILPNAYSPYAKTIHALPQLLNFGRKKYSADYFELGSKRLVENAYFREMSERGYALRVLQVPFIEFCAAEGVRLESCTTYTPERAGHLVGLHLDTPVRAKLLAAHFVADSDLIERVRRLYIRFIRPPLAALGAPLPEWEWDGDAGHGDATAQTFSRIAAAYQSRPTGILSFAHVFIPHYPYDFDAACRPNTSLAKRLNRDTRSVMRPQRNTAETRAERYLLYFGQVRCAMHNMENLLSEFERTGLLDDMVIIVHGDHGSRITRYDPSAIDRSLVSDQDLRDSFSTLFAVRAPGLEGGVDPAVASTEALLEALVDSGFSSTRTPPDGKPEVFLQAPRADGEKATAGVRATLEGLAWP